MTIHKKFIDQIIKWRNTPLYNLIGNQGLNLKAQVKDVDELIDQLDQIFYTIEFLEREKLIECKRFSNNTIVAIFDGLSIGSIDKIEAFHYIHDLLQKSAYSWNIEIKSGLIHFKQQGYLTDEQIRQKKQFWLTIGVALGASAVTAILTAILTKSVIVNCWPF